MVDIDIKLNPAEVRTIRAWATTVQTTMRKKMRTTAFRNWRPSEQAMYKVELDDIERLIAKLEATQVK